MSFFSKEQVADLKKGTVRIARLVKFEFKSQTVRVWDGMTELEILDGSKWLPTYGVGIIDGNGDISAGQSKSIVFTLSGVGSPDILSLALSESNETKGRLAYTYFQLFDGDWQPKGAPVLQFFGFMQTPEINETPMTETTGTTRSITLTAENILVNRSRPSYGRMTDSDHQSRHPGDRFCQFIPGLVEKTLVHPDY